MGQRGVGVRLITSLNDARDYLSAQLGPVVVQQYHPGPFEAGVFYYRMPGEPTRADPLDHRQALSISRRRWRIDTRRSDLGRAAPADAGRDVPGATRRPQRLASWPPASDCALAIAGNHAQGTLFRDGRHLITPALEDRIEQIARSYPGFFIGRFDMRYTDVERFKAGDDLAIVELNGATAESTNIYDPDNTLASAYRQLFRQWSLVFAIGDANLRRGAGRLTVARLVSLLRAHRTTRVAFEVSD